MESLLYNADSEGSTLLHLAVDSGILPVMKKIKQSSIQFVKLMIMSALCGTWCDIV